jgi:hypothetical protein
MANEQAKEDSRNLTPTQIVEDEGEKAIRSGIRKAIDQKLQSGIDPEELLGMIQGSRQQAQQTQAQTQPQQTDILSLLQGLTQQPQKAAGGVQGAFLKLVEPLQKVLSGTSSLEIQKGQQQGRQLENLLKSINIAQGVRGLEQTPQKQFEQKQVQEAQQAGVLSTGNPGLDTIIQLTRQTVAEQKNVAEADRKKAVLQAEKEFDLQSGAEQLESITGQFERAINEIEIAIPNVLASGPEGFLARKELQIRGTQLFDEFPELATLRDNLEATATPLAKLAGEDRLTNEDIQRFLKTLFDPTARSLKTNISKSEFQIRKLKKQGINTDGIQTVVDRLKDKLNLGGPDQQQSQETSTVQVGKFTVRRK